jgi:hypothetical protein
MEERRFSWESHRRTVHWEDNIKTDPREIEWGDMGWIDLAQDNDQWRLLGNMVKNHRVPNNIRISLRT